MLRTGYLVEIFDGCRRFMKFFRNASDACSYGASYIWNNRHRLEGDNESLIALESELFNEGSLTREFANDIPYVFVTVTECEVN